MIDERPFFPPGCRVRNSSIALDWRNLERILPEGTGDCLDLGCGDGGFRDLIEQRGYSWVGLDIAPRNNKLTVVGDAHSLPFAKETFQCVVVNGVLEHLSHPPEALLEANRVLRKGGTFCGIVAFMEPFHNSYYHFTHWGLELSLRESGFSVLEMQPGASIFRILPHFLLRSTRGERLEPLFARAMGYPSMFLVTAFGLMYLLWRYRSVSEAKRRFDRWLEMAAFRLASHILFVAKKTDAVKPR